MIVVVALAVWAVLAGLIAMGAVHWVTKKKREARSKAYEEILREKGVEKKPDETVKAALLRARRTERSVPPRPLPDFARSVLQRPASRPAFAVEDSTRHVGGHTAASSPGFRAVRPAGLLMPHPDPALRGALPRK